MEEAGDLSIEDTIADTTRCYDVISIDIATTAGPHSSKAKCKEHQTNDHIFDFAITLDFAGFARSLHPGSSLHFACSAGDDSISSFTSCEGCHF